MTVKLIKNTADHAFRFSPTLEFKPGETVAVDEETIKAYPSIGLLIKRGDLKEEGTNKTPQVTEDEVIEE